MSFYRSVSIFLSIHQNISLDVVENGLIEVFITMDQAKCKLINLTQRVLHVKKI